LMTGCAIPSTPGEEDGYGSSWRREWDGRRYHSRFCGRLVSAGRARPGFDQAANKADVA
jgi:hypothetical protein